MEILTKKHRKSEFNLKVEIIKKHFEGNHIQLDKQIVDTVCFLMAYGFNTIMSCEGHTVSSTVDTFRRFYPFVEITLNNKVVFDLEPHDKRTYFRVVTEDPFRALGRLEKLIVDFNYLKHRFSEKNSELAVVFTNDIFNPLRFREVIEKHWNVNVMVCDIGVHGILGMPQEFLTDDLRTRFLERTQRQMKQFTQFMRWNAIQNGIR